MEAVSSLYAIPRNPCKDSIFRNPPNRISLLSLSTISSSSSSSSSSLCFKNPVIQRRRRRRTWDLRATLQQSHYGEAREEYDVVIVGAGIIGLTIARQILLSSNLSVAIVDAKLPCSGATGAGQGYIWMAHQTPGSDVFELSMRSKQLWELLAESIQLEGMDPLQVLGWKKTGSLLIGRTSNEVAMLKRRVKMLSEAGLRAEYLSASDLLSEEPALEVGDDGGAAFFPDDCQLDAQRTVAFIEEGNKYFASQGRYREFYHNPVISLLRSHRNGEVEGVQTSKKILYSKRAIVFAAGSWSGSLMENLVMDSDVVLNVPVKPRKGHLLVLESFHQMQLKHGLMEVGYVDHKMAKQLATSASEVAVEEQALTSISMTATTDMMGNLVLGSSRQFTGFNTEVEESIINRIWERAGIFFPALRKHSLLNFISSRRIKVGLRPYSFDGKPFIGPVPGLSKVFLASGHEGCGLCMALGTAEMVADMVLGHTMKVNCAPFSIYNRCCR